MPENNNNSTTIIAVVALLVVVVGVFAFSSMNNNKNEMKDNKMMSSMSSMPTMDKAMDKMTKSDSMMMPKDQVMVGGAAMYANKNIVENVVNASNLTTLVTAVKAADLVETLKGAGPFTVFAPDNNAFAKVDKATLESLLKPENKAKLQAVLTYHVVSGNLVASSLKDGQILKTVQGGSLVVMKSGDKTMLKDENGSMSTITQADVFQSNGVAHIIDTVVLPKM